MNPDYLITDPKELLSMRMYIMRSKKVARSRARKRTYRRKTHRRNTRLRKARSKRYSRKRRAFQKGGATSKPTDEHGRRTSAEPTEVIGLVANGKKAAEEVDASGGVATLVFNLPTLVSGLKAMPNLRELNLSESNLNNDDLTHLKSLTDLTELWLGRNQISNVTSLASLTKLTLLDLEHNNIVDVTPLAYLNNLSVLDLRGNPVTNTNMGELRPLQKTSFKVLPAIPEAEDTELSGNAAEGAMETTSW